MPSITNNPPPPLDPKKYDDDAQRSYTRAYNEMVAKGLDPKSAADAAHFGAMLTQGIKTGISSSLVGIINVTEPLIAGFLDAISKVRQDGLPAFSELSAAALSEFLGTSITVDQAQMGKGVDHSIAVSQAIGKALMNRLETEFGGNGTVTPESGQVAAQTFAGFAVNFAVQNELISTICDALSNHYLEDVRELGVEVAQNLGLGRLVRRALQPLIQETITTPYTKYLKAKYHQDNLSDANVIKAYFMGAKTQDDLNRELGWKGYTDADTKTLVEIQRPDLTVAEICKKYFRGELQITDTVAALEAKGYSPADAGSLVAQQIPALSLSQIATLVRFGEMGQDSAIQLMRTQGTPPEVAQQQLRAEILSGVKTIEDEYLALLDTQVNNGLLDPLQASALRREHTHLFTEELDAWETLQAQKLQVPYKRASFTQMVDMLKDGIVNISDLQNWLISERYSSQEQFTLFLFALYQLSAAQQKAAAAKKKTTGPYTEPTLAEIKKFYSTGELTLQQATDYIKGLGFDPTITQVLIADLAAIAPAPH